MGTMFSSEEAAPAAPPPPAARPPAYPIAPRSPFDAAQAVLEVAVQADTAGNYALAFQKYHEALEIIVPLLKDMAPPTRAALEPKIVSYMQRAEMLKGVLKPGSGGSPVLPGRPGPALRPGAAATPAPYVGLPLKPAVAPAATGEAAELEAEILSEVMDNSKGVPWAAVAGLEFAKEQLQEAVIRPTLRPDLYTGLRAPPKGVLLFGPPGTGKTMLAKAVAQESGATFFSLSASSLMSKWVGEGEKRVRALFNVAARHSPSVIFIDEVDSMLSKRSDGENEASRRLKTEFMVQLDGANGNPDCHVFLLAATNRPWEIDDAILRRLSKKIYIPLPDPATRKQLIEILLRGQPHNLNAAAVSSVVKKSEGYSCSDLTELCREAARLGVRRLDSVRLLSTHAADVDPISSRDFDEALRVIRPSVSPASLEAYRTWNAARGSS